MQTGLSELTSLSATTHEPNGACCSAAPYFTKAQEEDEFIGMVSQ